MRVWPEQPRTVRRCGQVTILSPSNHCQHLQYGSCISNPQGSEEECDCAICSVRVTWLVPLELGETGPPAPSTVRCIVWRSLSRLASWEFCYFLLSPRERTLLVRYYRKGGGGVNRNHHRLWHHMASNGSNISWKSLTLENSGISLTNRHQTLHTWRVI